MVLFVKLDNIGESFYTRFQKMEGKKKLMHAQSNFFENEIAKPIFFQGGDFFKVSIDGINKNEDFWKTIKVRFSLDGT